MSAFRLGSPGFVSWLRARAREHTTSVGIGSSVGQPFHITPPGFVSRGVCDVIGKKLPFWQSPEATQLCPFPSSTAPASASSRSAKRQHDLTSPTCCRSTPRPTSTTPPCRSWPNGWSTARKVGAARILVMGAHVLRAGVQRHLIDLMERGLIDHIAMNGAGPIHDWEFALIGATTESVARYVRTGEFGLWDETGRHERRHRGRRPRRAGPRRSGRAGDRRGAVPAQGRQRPGRRVPAAGAGHGPRRRSATTSSTSTPTATGPPSGRRATPTSSSSPRPARGWKAGCCSTSARRSWGRRCT